MNIYVVVEGEVGEKRVYDRWIRYVNPALSPVSSIADVVNDHYYIVGGGGYPSYFEIIEAAIEDVQSNPQFDRLVVAIDSEDQTLAAKYAEVEDVILGRGFTKPYRIIVQHFCLEAWALGNRTILSRAPQNQALAAYKRLHDVSVLDPELLPALPDEELNRAQLAEKYLRLALNERHRNLTYTKSNPEQLFQAPYFDQLRRRRAETNHIDSFGAFLTAFL